MVMTMTTYRTQREADPSMAARYKPPEQGSGQKNKEIWLNFVKKYILGILRGDKGLLPLCRGRPKAEVILSAENRNRKSIVSAPKPHSR